MITADPRPHTVVINIAKAWFVGENRTPSDPMKHGHSSSLLQMKNTLLLDHRITSPRPVIRYRFVHSLLSVLRVRYAVSSTGVVSRVVGGERGRERKFELCHYCEG